MFSQAAGESGYHDQVIFALIALVGTSITALVYVIRNGKYAKQGAEDAAATNAAVNNVGPGQHKLYDLVQRIHDDVVDLKKDQEQFDSHGWETLPADLNSAVALTSTIRDLQHHYERVDEKLDTLIGELRDHVAWEMGAKYGVHGGE